MYKPFNELAETSRVWIYQSNRRFSEQEEVAIQKSIHDFLQNWESHGNTLTSSFQIRYNRFIIIAVNEADASASGCSIDKSVAIIKEIEKEYAVSLFDRTQIAYLKQNQIHISPLSAMEENVKQGVITPDTIVFNNLVQTKALFHLEWQIPAKQTWLARYF